MAEILGFIPVGEYSLSMENWRPAVGWEVYYEVSDLGRVRSVTRMVEQDFGNGRGVRRYDGKIIYIYHDVGCSRVRLSGGGRKATRKVHRLVVEAFIGSRPPGKEVAHWNGDPNDNRLANLRYATPVENNADKKRHGTHLVGEARANSKVTEEQARIARNLPKGKIKAFAEQIGVTPPTLYQIRSGVTWRHV